MKDKFSKTQLDNLRIDHNKLVLSEYKIQAHDQEGFNQWWKETFHLGEDLGGGDGCPCLSYAEIASYSTTSGRAEILELR
jgi:hypothetical protein